MRILSYVHVHATYMYVLSLEYSNTPFELNIKQRVTVFCYRFIFSSIVRIFGLMPPSEAVLPSGNAKYTNLPHIVICRFECLTSSGLLVSFLTES